MKKKQNSLTPKRLGGTTTNHEDPTLITDGTLTTGSGTTVINPGDNLVIGTGSGNSTIQFPPTSPDMTDHFGITTQATGTIRFEPSNEEIMDKLDAMIDALKIKGKVKKILEAKHIVKELEK